MQSNIKIKTIQKNIIFLFCIFCQKRFHFHFHKTSILNIHKKRLWGSGESLAPDAFVTIFEGQQKFLMPTRNKLLMAKHLFSHQFPLSLLGSLKNVYGAKPLLSHFFTPKNKKKSYLDFSLPYLSFSHTLAKSVSRVWGNRNPQRFL